MSKSANYCRQKTVDACKAVQGSSRIPGHVLFIPVVTPAILLLRHDHGMVRPPTARDFGPGPYISSTVSILLGFKAAASVFTGWAGIVRIFRCLYGQRN